MRSNYLKQKIETLELLENEEQKMVEDLKQTKQHQSTLIDKLKTKIAGRRVVTEAVQAEGQPA